MWYVVIVFWFFFFKQKTAYEMRISDWSSDVCSSDLVAELDDAAVLCVLAEDDVGDLGRERREQPALQGAQELRRGILRVDRVGILVFVLRRRDAAQMRGIERVAADTGFDRLLDDILHVARIGDGATERSEEHPSE